MEEQNFCLRWDSYQSSITAVFDQLRRDGRLVDVTLCAEGLRLGAHRIVLAACSPYFRDVLSENQCPHIVLFLRDTPAADLRAVVEFMYRGTVNVAQSQLASFIKTAEMLQIRGLSGEEEVKSEPTQERPERSASSGSSGSSGSAAREPPPPAKRWRQSPAPAPAAAPAVKVEKLEPVDEDGDVTLNATLGCVAAYEDARLEGAGPAGLAVPVQPGPVPASPGFGRGVGQASRSVSYGSQHPCDICGKVYKYRISLLAHRKHHEGRTNCFLCGHTSSTVQNLRQHLRFVHRLAAEEVSRRTGLQRVRPPILGPQTAGRWPGPGGPVLPQGAVGQLRPAGYGGQGYVPRGQQPGRDHSAAGSSTLAVGDGMDAAAGQARPAGYGGQSNALRGQQPGRDFAASGPAAPAVGDGTDCESRTAAESVPPPVVDVEGSSQGSSLGGTPVEHELSPDHQTAETGPSIAPDHQTVRPPDEQTADH